MKKSHKNIIDIYDGNDGLRDTIVTKINKLPEIIISEILFSEPVMFESTSHPNYKDKDHHSSKDSRKLGNELSENELLAKFIGSITSGENKSFQRGSIIISKQTEKIYSTKIVDDSDAGYSVLIYLKDTARFTNIFFAKLVRLIMKKYKNSKINIKD